MLDFTAFFDPDEVGALVPPEYARYRRAVVEGLAVFVLQLSPARIARIHASQAALPKGAPAEERLFALARQSPVLHKLAQVLARDRRLPAALRRLFQLLETMPPSATPATIAGWVEAETGPLARLGLAFDGPPLAEASVAMVTPFIDRDGRERGVFKVLKPGIEALLSEDLAALEVTGGWLDERCHELGLPEIAYQSTFVDVSRLLAQEVRLDQEQRNLAAAGATYAAMPGIVIPRLHPASKPRLTAMSRIDGRKVTGAGELAAVDRGALARRIADALVAHPLWSPEPKGLFHADPHAGNLMVTPSGDLAILDWALAGTLWKHERIPLAQILLGAFTLDARRIVAAIEALARPAPRRSPLERHVYQAMQRLMVGGFPGMRWLCDLLDGVAKDTGAGFSPDLILFRKSVHTLEGVIADVDERTGLDGTIALRLISQLTLESGTRWLAHPRSRNFGSHLSNQDLLDLMTAGPLSPFRFWWRR